MDVPVPTSAKTVPKLEQSKTWSNSSIHEEIEALGLYDSPAQKDLREANMIAIDDAHCDLIYGLVRAFKPHSVLEFGYGTGKSALAIHRACTANDQPFRQVIVDNWVDWGGSPPSDLLRNFVTTADEEDFVRTTDQKFDFILCDADHQKTDKYWRRIYFHLLNRSGIVLFHDVTNPDYPNLQAIVDESVQLNQALFNMNSQPNERCDRGLLALFK